LKGKAREFQWDKEPVPKSSGPGGGGGRTTLQRGVKELRRGKTGGVTKKCAGGIGSSQGVKFQTSNVKPSKEKSWEKKKKHRLVEQKKTHPNQTMKVKC